MNRNESFYTRKLCRSLEAQGAVTYPLIGGAHEVNDTIIGAPPPYWPDRFIAHARWQGFIEVKSHGGKVSAGQLQVMNWLVERSVNVYVCRFAHDWYKVNLTRHDGKHSGWGRWSEFFDLCEILSR